MFKLLISVLATLMIIDAEIAIAAMQQVSQLPELPKEAPWYISVFEYVLLQFPEINAWFGVAMIFTMTILRAFSELLNFISEKTETKSDDQMAANLTAFLKWLSRIVSWFGLGSPKQLLKKKKKRR